MGENDHSKAEVFPSYFSNVYTSETPFPSIYTNPHTLDNVAIRVLGVFGLPNKLDMDKSTGLGERYPRLLR